MAPSTLPRRGWRTLALGFSLILVCTTIAVPASAQAGTTYYVSDLTPTLANNGSGPVEKDRAVGEWNTVGGTLTMQGSTWPKGLGTHALSDVRYTLGGVCSTFTAMIGIDDEVDFRGSVIFKVYADGAIAHTSGTMGGSMGAQPVSVNVSGKNELQLVVTDAGDGISYDHADWADAKVVCTSAPGTTPTPTPTPAPQAQPRLIKDYYVHQPLAAAQDIYDDVIYRPNQFKPGLVHKTDTCYGANVGCTDGQQKWTVNSAGAYDGWDVLLMADESPTLKQGTGTAAFDLTLTRPATLAIVKLATESMPQLANGGWVASGTVSISGGYRPNEATVYKKSFPAGKVDMPGPSPDGRPVIPYWVLLAESNGTPSAYPAAPSGRTQPTANTTCPSWVHDQYVTVDGSGATRNTWHPQIDPVYWCYFRHEHGSNPALFHADYKPAFGYAAAAAGENEAHNGFKVALLPPMDGYQWIIVQHLGSAGIARACNRFHEMQLAAKNSSTNEIVASFLWMADFGRSISDAATNESYTPTACPNQASAAAGTPPLEGNRVIPRRDLVGGNFGYEPWTHGLTYPRQTFGLLADFSPNTTQPIVICNTRQCDAPYRNAQTTGTARFMAYNGPNGQGLIAGANTGTFWTDAWARTVVPSGTAGALRQFVKAGAVVPMKAHVAGIECYDVYAFGRTLVCGNDTDVPSGGSQERELSILLPDGSANN